MPTMIDQNVKLPLSTLINTFSKYSKKANTNQERYYLYQLVHDLGTTIANVPPGFEKEFMTACGVQPEWANVAA